MSALVLAFPSKGRLQEQALEFLADCGMGVRQDGRIYSARIPALPEAEIRLMASSEIVTALRDGTIHAGITGEDVLREADPQLKRVVLVKPLGFGRADLVVAAPQSWIDVETMADLAAVCADFHARAGRRLRVATKYLTLAQAFFEAKGIDDYRLVESAGATEGAPASGAAEIIVDITTTGQTLADNYLRPLADGLILSSQANLAASRTARWDEPAMAAFARLLDAIEARGRAKQTRLLRAAGGSQEALAARAAALGCATAGAGDLYCPAERAQAVCAALQDAGFGPIGVFAPDYVFSAPNVAMETFRATLRATA